MDNLIDIYHNSPDIDSLYKTLSHTLRSPVIIIGWKVVDNLWYIPAIYDNATIDKNKYDKGWYLDEVPSDRNIPNVYKINKPFNIKLFNEKILLYKSDISITKTYMFIIEMFISNLKNKDAQKRYKFRTDLLLSNICHSIRTPLNGILHTTNMIMESDKTIAKPHKNINKKHLEYLNKSVVSLANNIFDIIDVTQLNLGKLKIVKSSFNVREMVNDVYKIANSLNKSPNIIIKQYVDPIVPLYAYSDMKRIKQILVHLLENAINSTSNGEIILFVDANLIYDNSSIKSLSSTAPLHNLLNSIEHTQPNTQTDILSTSPTSSTNTINKNKQIEEKKHRTLDIDRELSLSISDFDDETPKSYNLIITVSDTGMGIKDEHIRNIFRPPEVTNNSKQYGIGLRVSYLLSKRLGGSLRLKKSVINKGSSFEFNLVVSEEQAPTYDNNSIKSLKNKSVLIIDKSNDKINLGKVLNNYSLNYTIASTYDEVLMLHYNKQYDLIIIKKDTQLTDDIIRQIKEHWGKSLYMGITSDNHKKIYHETITTPIEDETFLLKLITIFNTDYNTSNTNSMINILIVDDEEINRIVLEKLLRQRGYKNIDIAINGRDALQMIKQDPANYDLLLLDIRMPLMSGFELADELYKLYGDQAPKMIGQTAQMIMDNEPKPYFNQFVYKPINMKILEKKINMLFNE